MPAYKTREDALAGITSAFSPTTDEQRQAIARAVSEIPTAVTPESMAPTQPIVVSTPPAPVIPTTGNTPVPTNPAPTDTPENKPTDFESILKGFMDTSTTPPSASDTYSSLESSSGVAEATRLKNERAQKTSEAQGRLNEINKQLAVITAQAQAIPIQLEQGAVGRGITTASLASQTAGELRKNALQAIPLQAQAFGAQADVALAQGNEKLAQDMLDQAQTHLDKVFEMHMTDATNQYNYKKDLRDKVYEFATNKEKARLDALQKADDRAFQMKQSAIDDQKELARFAIQQGQSSLASKIAGLDPDSPTFQADIAKLQGQITIPPKETSYEIKTINGVDMLFNPRTGALTPAGTGSASGTTSAQAKQLTTVNDMNTILNNPAFNGVMGVQGMVRRNIPNTPEFALKSQIETLVSSLALGARGALKGQGAVSDFEGKLLRDAQTAFRLNMSPEDGRKALIQARGAIITSSGYPAMVKVTSPDGVSKMAPATSDQISDLIKEGNVVEYQ